MQWQQRSTRVITFDVMKLLISIVIVLALFDVFEASVTTCLWLILASQASLVFTWTEHR
jgi:hypothetical protein